MAASTAMTMAMQAVHPPAFLPGLAWNAGGWTACIAMVIAVLAAMALIAALAYRGATA